jgi:hypothetical protein
MDNLNLAEILTDLSSQLATLKASNESLMDTLARQETRHQESIEALRNELNEIKQTSARPAPAITISPVEENPAPVTGTSGDGSSPTNLTPAATPIVSQPPTLSERLPDPPTFSGRRSELRTFIELLHNKLTGNQDRYPTEESRLRYAIGRLRNEASALAGSFRPDTVQNLVNLLENTYGDPNRKTTAQRKLVRMNQGNRSFPSFFAEFHRYAQESEWNDPALITRLIEALHPDLRRALIGVDFSNNLVECANIIGKRYNDMLMLLPKKNDYNLRHQTTKSQPTPRRDPDAMEIDASSYTPLRPEERERRLQKDLCFRCGKHGHFVRNCPYPPPKLRSSSLLRTRHSSTDSSATLLRNASRRSSHSSSSSPDRSRGRKPNRRSRSNSLKASSRR